MRRASVALEAQPELLVHLCRHLGLTVQARPEPSGDEELFPNRILVTGPDASWLAANRALGLDALQFILHEAHGERDETKLAHLDVQGSRRFRMHEVKAMAEMAMGKARELGRHTFQSLNSRERRWVHLLVARESDLVSESEGTGSLKPLTIRRKA